MKATVASLVAALLFAVTANATEKPKCAKVMPKGGGAIVHGIFVPLDPNEFLQVCKYQWDR